jgi:hypothetical protein
VPASSAPQPATAAATATATAEGNSFSEGGIPHSSSSNDDSSRGSTGKRGSSGDEKVDKPSSRKQTVASEFTTQAGSQWAVPVTVKPGPPPGTKAAQRGITAQRAGLQQAAGAALLVQLLRSAGKPLVLHNGPLDLAYLVHHLVGISHMMVIPHQ